MKLQFFGGARTVTGSMHYLEVNGCKILLECGLFQGRRAEMYEKNHHFPFDPASLDFLLLSHAHIDHSGNIPNLVKKGFKGRILATAPTVDLCKIMLKDSAFLQEMDVRWVNKLRAKTNKPLVEPLYSMADAEACLQYFESIEYDQTLELAKGIKVTFRDAGHILGSAGILLEINEKGRLRRLGFTGDLGRKDTVVLCDPKPLHDLNILISETTYGNRQHPPQEDIEENLAQLIQEVTKKGGKILIPSFAVGRTQQLVYYLHKLFNQNRIPDIPVYVDSPMASKATNVFRQHPEVLDREADRVFLKANEDPFDFKRLTYVDSAEESKKLNNLVYPHIIISASGMAEGGRIMHHLRNNIENPNCTILFVGFAAQHTLARKIREGNEVVKIFGEEFKVKARVKTMDEFSAHGDRRDILNYVNFSKPNDLQHIFLVHGEVEQAETLINAYRSKGYRNVVIPEPGEMFEI